MQKALINLGFAISSFLHGMSQRKIPGSGEEHLQLRSLNRTCNLGTQRTIALCCVLVVCPLQDPWKTHLGLCRTNHSRKNKRAFGTGGRTLTRSRCWHRILRIAFRLRRQELFVDLTAGNTPAPLSAQLSIESKCKAFQVMCNRHTTTHQFIWQQPHTCRAVGGSPMECEVGWQPWKTPNLHHRLWYRPFIKGPPNYSLGPAITASPLPPEIANGSGCDASRRGSHSDLPWHPFSSTSTSLTCQPPSPESIHTLLMETGRQWKGCWAKTWQPSVYLQTWKLKLRTTKTVSAVLHVNNKEAKREPNVNHNNETLP